MPESLNLMKFANAKSADADLFSGFMQGFIDLVIIMKKGVLLLNQSNLNFIVWKHLFLQHVTKLQKQKPISKKDFSLLQNYFIKQSFESDNDIRKNHQALTKSRNTSRGFKGSRLMFLVLLPMLTTFPVKQFWINQSLILKLFIYL